jgi:hypothetical protein
MDLKGQRFGRLGVLRKIPRKELQPPLCDEPNSFWHCECECGTACIVRGSNLARGITRSCGCYKLECVRMNLQPRAPRPQADAFGRLPVGASAAVQR